VTVLAVVLMLSGAVLIFRAVVVVSRGQSGLYWFDLPLSIIGGFTLALLGQAMLRF
jgi:hypothetical protein